VEIRMTVALSYKRRIETAVKALAAVYADIAELTADGSVFLKEAYDFNEDTKGCSIVVSIEGEQNANLAASGGGAYWTAQLVLHVRQAISKDKTRTIAGKAKGASERFLASLTAASLTTALSGQGVTVYGLTAGEPQPETILGERDSFALAAAITLHYAVS
jgi:hypothetical protein